MQGIFHLLAKDEGEGGRAHFHLEGHRLGALEAHGQGLRVRHLLEAGALVLALAEGVEAMRHVGSLVFLGLGEVVREVAVEEAGAELPLADEVERLRVGELEDAFLRGPRNDFRDVAPAVFVGAAAIEGVIVVLRLVERVFVVVVVVVVVISEIVAPGRLFVASGRHFHLELESDTLREQLRHGAVPHDAEADNWRPRMRIERVLKVREGVLVLLFALVDFRVVDAEQFYGAREEIFCFFPGLGGSAEALDVPRPAGEDATAPPSCFRHFRFISIFSEALVDEAFEVVFLEVMFVGVFGDIFRVFLVEVRHERRR